MVLGCFWWLLLVLVGSWCFLVVFCNCNGFWWFLVALVLFVFLVLGGFLVVLGGS